MRSNSLDDGFGNIWMKCRSPECDLQIVRPGKVQCSDYCDEAGWDEEEEDQATDIEPNPSG